MAAPPTFDRRQMIYASYVLAVLILVYLFNFIDRQLPSILAERIKTSLSVSDAELGFLYGTAFAVFYAIFGIPLGRLADVWNRRSLVAVGLGFWSLMTAASGFSRNLTELTIARIGVGVGEASATPAAYSMLSDYFPASMRATAISLYSSGIYLGGGLALFVGGRVLSFWDGEYAGGGAPFGLEGWQATFVLVGLPGLLMALWVRTLREPVRGQADGMITPPHPHPFREFGLELRAVLPGFTIWNLRALGGGSAAVRRNLLTAAGITIAAGALATVTGDVAQWVALGIGSYAAASWAQSLALRDAPSFALIFGTPTLRRSSPPPTRPSKTASRRERSAKTSTTGSTWRGSSCPRSVSGAKTSPCSSTTSSRGSATSSGATCAASATTPWRPWSATRGPETSASWRT